ncbi:MAG: hypothetical protein RJB58_2550 [Pseudomonadota bacterium]|jgi:hypothetical protein
MGVRIHDVFLATAMTLAVATPVLANWQDRASSPDTDRLVQLPQTRARAMEDARTGEGRGDWRVIPRAMQAEGRAIPANAMIGNWRCRQIKLGGVSAYMVYNKWFSCRIRPYNGGLVFEKLNGTQRMGSFLYPEKGAWVYLGSSAVRGERIDPYSGRTPSIGAAVTPDDQIGLLTGIGNNHLRLEIPAVQESLLDVVELVR